MKLTHCIAKKINGESCEATAKHDSPYCFFHDPDEIKKRASASSKGGKNKRRKTLSSEAANFSFRSANEIKSLLALSINEVITGNLDIKVATTVGYLANILLKSFEQIDIEERITKIEQNMGDSGT